MPSSKAVLADIHNLKLDPSRAHRKIRSSGHLAVPATPEPLAVSHVVVTSVEDVAEPVVSEPVLATMARLMEEIVEEETPEPVLPEPVLEPTGEAFRAIVQRVGEPPFSMMATSTPPEAPEVLEVAPVADQIASKAEEALDVSASKKKPFKKGKKDASADRSGNAS